jgi:NitT/TauT family transport system substrate-binding protein
VPGKFGESWFGLLAALAGANLTQSDVDVVEIGYTAQAALTTGKVEAVVGFSNNDQVKFGPRRASPPGRCRSPPTARRRCRASSLVTTTGYLSTPRRGARKSWRP